MSQIPSQQQLIDNSLHYLRQALLEGVDLGNPAELAALDARLGRENNDVFAFISGTGIHGNYLYLQNYLAKQTNPLTATDDFFTAWTNAIIGGIKPANPAEGTVTFTGTPYSVIDADTDLELNEIIYLTSETTTIAEDRTATVEIIAVGGGTNTNQAAGVKLNLVNPISGIDDQVTVTAGGLNRGTDKETLDQAKERLKQWFRYRPLGGAPHDYVNWALSVPGITRAWGLRTPSGPGTAGVIIMADGNDNDGIPSKADRQAVYNCPVSPRYACFFYKGFISPLR